MISKNFFEGDSFQAIFSRISYRLLMSRKGVTYADVMANYLGTTMEKLPYALSKCDQYGELKKAFPNVCDTIKEICGEDCIIEEGNNRSKKYTYIGKEDNPLEDLLNAQAIKDLKEYWNFCQDSAGFFPIAWLEYFFKNSLDLLDIRKKENKGEQVIHTSIDRVLHNIEYLPLFYEAIKQQQVLHFTYHPFCQDPFEVTFHPHYLKEFNGRWFVFGIAEGIDIPAFNIALDRIDNKPSIVAEVVFQAAKAGFYKNFFNDIVGVTHHADTPITRVVLHTKSPYIHGLMVTKPMHSSQKEVMPFGEHGKENFGEVTLEVCPNNELIGKILTYGKELEVIEPLSLRENIIQHLKEQLNIYLS